MKNILFTLFAILILTSCSKDDDNWIELNENISWVIGRQALKARISF